MTEDEMVALANDNPKALERLKREEEERQMGAEISRRYQPGAKLTREDVIAMIADLDGAELIKLGEKEVKIGLNLSMKDVSGEDLSGLNLRSATCSPGFKANGTKFDNCDMRGTNLHGASLDGASFNRALLDDSNFCQACVCRARFYTASMTKCNLSESCGEDTEGLDYTTFKPKDLNKIALKGGRVSVENGVGKLFGRNLDGANLTAMSNTHVAD